MNTIERTSYTETVMTRVIFDFVTLQMTSLETKEVIFGAEAWIGDRLIKQVMNFATEAAALRELRFELTNIVVEIL